MKHKVLVGTTAAAIAIMVSTSGVCEDGNTASLVALPPAAMKGTMSLEEAIAQRRSVRKFTDAPLSIEQVGRLCWAGQGITEPRRGLRASPSAGALYPIDIYVVTAEGVDQYQPDPHGLRRHLAGDMRPALRRAALNQEVLSEAPVCLVIAAVPQKLAQRYGQRSMRYCLIEAGYVAQNILLQATALGLAGVPVGAFEDAQVAEVLKFPSGTEVLYLLPIGNPRT